MTPPTPPSAAAGLDRFVWDLHYAKPKGEIERGDDEEDAGVWASPGRYQVELKADGQTFRQPLEVRPDPRLTGPQDFAAQFELAHRVEALRLRAGAALHEATALHGRLAAAAAAGGAKAAQVKALDAELVRLTDIPTTTYPPGNLSPQPRSVAGLPWLNGQLAGLARAVDGADAAPSPDAREGVEQTAAALDAALGK